MSDLQKRLIGAAWSGFKDSPFVEITERDAESVALTLLPLVEQYGDDRAAAARLKATEDARVIHRGIIAQATREAEARGRAEVVAAVEAFCDANHMEDEAGAHVVYVWELRAALASTEGSA